MKWSSCRFAVLALLVLAANCLSAFAQNDRGFSAKARAVATGEELSLQPGIWICEVTFKPVRLVWADLTDPKTGEKSRELVWYLCYKAINRPLVDEKDTSDVTPMNDDDPPPSEPMFVPEFTLVSEDDGEQKVYHDVVLPEAQAVILKREQRRAGDPRLKNSVEVIGPIPAATAVESPSNGTIWGVAMFRGVDPEIDRFSIYMTGFSNGFKVVKGPEGDLVLRRTIKQEYWRPGDRFAQHETEFRLKGEPVWSYRPEDVKNTENVEPITPGAPATPKAPAGQPTE